MDVELGKRVLDLKERIVSHFSATNWDEVGLLTGHGDLISKHPRLLRSLSWGDEDYSGNALSVLRQIASVDVDALSVIENYLDLNFPDETRYISARPSPIKITFAPNVFHVPEFSVESDLVAVMMPFRAEFQAVYAAIKASCQKAGFRCLRVDDVWEESIIIQEVFNLIFRARIVIVDFSGKNPNVMYETGIAHTLGKLVIPVSQSLDDVPFDMAHHRVLKYLLNQEGLSALESMLSDKLRQVSI